MIIDHHQRVAAAVLNGTRAFKACCQSCTADALCRIGPTLELKQKTAVGLTHCVDSESHAPQVTYLCLQLQRPGR